MPPIHLRHQPCGSRRTGLGGPGCAGGRQLEAPPLTVPAAGGSSAHLQGQKPASQHQTRQMEAAERGCVSASPALLRACTIEPPLRTPTCQTRTQDLELRSERAAGSLSLTRNCSCSRCLTVTSRLPWGTVTFTLRAGPA
ncbi:unnamed protein product [Rangifer tarandus platyrhynchus]|uniref:Uncharacterized protein n=1 Tax=Rangifer tarandus platyrhynchus TaxID=3082113 RepID=A0AC59YS45_RANTA